MERRKYERFSAVKGSYASLSPNSNRVGQIVNISRGGLAFQYFDSANDSMPFTETDLFLSSSRHYVHKIPIKQVFEQKVKHARKSMRRCRIQFGEMSPEQVVQLDAFLWGNIETGVIKGKCIEYIPAEEAPFLG